MARPFFRKKTEDGGGKPLLGFFIVVASFALAILFYRGLPGRGEDAGTASLAAGAARLGKGFIPLRVEILSRAEGSLRARFEFRDASGEEFVAAEKEFKGDSLSLECCVLPLSPDASLVFPLRAYGNGSPSLLDDYRLGLDLASIYGSSGFPGMYGGLKQDKAGLSALEGLFRLVERDRTSSGKGGGFGPALQKRGAVRLILVLPDPAAGSVWNLVLDPDGRATLRLGP